ncbi:hypothetical protein SVAN01_07465 [Stagonosporopsis vannaccii]|nr:hypothetical protein SVAN01_07465 [Stagonosporopsis vannaccii]
MHAPTIFITMLTILTGSVAACKCKKVSKEGLYCGYCAQVTDYGKDGGFFNVYWCNKKGGCDDLGLSTTRCQKDSKLYCDGRSKWKRDDESENVVEIKFES